MLQPFTLHVQTIAGNIVQLKTDDGQTLNIPMSSIHGTPKAGGDLRLIAVVPGSEISGETAFVKIIINELLSPSS